VGGKVLKFFGKKAIKKLKRKALRKKIGKDAEKLSRLKNQRRGIKGAQKEVYAREGWYDDVQSIRDGRRLIGADMKIREQIKNIKKDKRRKARNRRKQTDYSNLSAEAEKGDMSNMSDAMEKSINKKFRRLHYEEKQEAIKEQLKKEKLKKAKKKFKLIRGGKR